MESNQPDQNNPQVLHKTSSFTTKDDPALKSATDDPNHDHPPAVSVDNEADVKSVEESKDNKEEKENEKEKEEEEETSKDEPDLDTILEDLDQFLSTTRDQHSVVEIPKFIHKFLDLIDAKVEQFENAESNAKEEESKFMEAVDRIPKLRSAIEETKLEDQKKNLLINRIGSIQQRAISYMEEKFRLYLEKSQIVESESDVGESNQQNHFSGYSDEIMMYLKQIANQMIAGGFESECFRVYIVARRYIFEETLHKLGFEKHSIDDIHKMNWESLEREIGTWIVIFKQCTTVLLSSERDLAESVFSLYPQICTALFKDLTRGIIIQLLNFSEGVGMAKRSAEKLFKLLDMYEALRDQVPKMEKLYGEETANELKTESTAIRTRLGEAAIYIFCDLENSIKADTGKTPVPGGAVHPLTRYTINYLKYACEYRNTLEQIFKEHAKIERADSTSRGHTDPEEQRAEAEGNESAFSVELRRVMELLDGNLEAKSKLYKDVALSSIFMMNNGRYVLQKIKGSADIKELVGDNWYRKRSSDLRQYHKSYQRETWGRLLGCLNHEGLMVHGKVAKPVLKEKFKAFNSLFEDIHKTQSSWIISDDQLQSELRVSISAVMIPAYRSFLARFSQYLDPGRQTEKYIKLQPEDIETYIDDLFDGNPSSMARKR